MSNIWGAYLEDYNLIKVIIPLDTNFDKFILKGDTYLEELIIIKKETFANELHLFLSYQKEVYLYLDYYVKIANFSFHLDLGKITRTPRFEEEFYYDGTLGHHYTKKYTEFRLWSPVSKDVYLFLNNKRIRMNYLDKGVWYTKVNKNIEGASYYYIIRINEQEEKVLDPYAFSSSSNNEVNYVIDLNKTFGLKHSFNKPNNNIIIYEANLRDLSGNVDNSDSLYLKAIDYLDYIKKLGITHLQLMPTFSFGGVNENVKNHNDDGFKYNWGYNPVQYLIPSGWYASNPDDPYVRINEFKQLIDAIHERDMSVVLDVVFNHVYEVETFSYGRIVPGYVYRTDEQGFLMNSSYCGNDLRTEAKMIRKYILDIVKFYQKYYKVDGFRFDLMGLIDNITMREVLKESLKVNKNAILYGEGWYMRTTLKMDENANLSSAAKLYPIKYFNDYFRNAIGGKNGSLGYILGEKFSLDTFKNLILEGSTLKMPFKDFNQSINYLECHDNFTLRDKIYYQNKDFKIIKNACKLGLGLVIISNGIAFIHAGEELMRSKQGIDNSYNLPDDINHFPWENINTDSDLSEYLKNLIICKQSNIFDHVDSFYDKKDYFEIRYGYNKYQVIIKNNYLNNYIYFSPNTRLIFNNGESLNKKCESLQINEPGIWIFEK